MVKRDICKMNIFEIKNRFRMNISEINLFEMNIFKMNSLK